MQFTIATVMIATTAIHGATAQLCEPDFYAPDIVQFSSCATANAAGTDPAPMVAYMSGFLGCQNIINGDTNPLTGIIKAHQCHQGFAASDEVPGFLGNSILLEVPCQPGDKCP
ncbi:unnamed protein product [Periconia digitata]|uniref:Uncharacterized protein n=1 Tax=Periconia digitata TaxID=1303443 RepID=A0A9W4U6N4_9PLEO|nr:unnamed protein product [Periconia digitata]